MSTMTATMPWVLSLLLYGVWVTMAADMSVDLRNGKHTASIPGLEWLVEPEELKTSQGICDRLGLLKITFSKERVRVRLNMTFVNPSNFSFNFGDSRTNDGWGGDAGTQDKDAEVFMWNRRLVLASNEIGKRRGGSYEFLYDGDDFIGRNESLLVDVANNMFSAEKVNSGAFIYFNSFKLFAVKNQEDEQGGINHDIYLGMNRVVSDASASDSGTGTGLCHVEITWHDTPF